MPEVIVSDKGAENKNGGSGPPNKGTVRVSLLIPSWLVVDISNETPTASVGRSNALCTSTTNTPVDSSNMAAFHRPPLKPGPLDRPVEEPTITSLAANWVTSCGSVASMSTNNDRDSYVTCYVCLETDRPCTLCALSCTRIRCQAGHTFATATLDAM